MPPLPIDSCLPALPSSQKSPSCLLFLTTFLPSRFSPSARTFLPADCYNANAFMCDWWEETNSLGKDTYVCWKQSNWLFKKKHPETIPSPGKQKSSPGDGRKAQEKPEVLACPEHTESLLREGRVSGEMNHGQSAWAHSKTWNDTAMAHSDFPEWLQVWKVNVWVYTPSIPEFWTMYINPIHIQ